MTKRRSEESKLRYKAAAKRRVEQYGLPENFTRKGVPVTEETRRKMSMVRKGVPKSPETRAKMSEAHKRAWSLRRAMKKFINKD